ncbi:hypothetical protein F1654_08090 [Alkalicaulis satelles]|uniref:Uncharacterized protein n=1 Tax=Alkalicaulis satelles TaxID=2609175 RepID=A0A5M6ZHI6_9PROT|nr:hypothetical protein [Alkalicaulis satelles]KAA5803750.1 hypothetical protein F1654_08090 [Alkalicaulis satelles]
MFQRGLNDGEIAQLVAAGFSSALATAVAREALTMRWLSLRRGVSGVWAAVTAALIGLALFLISMQSAALGVLIAVAGSILSFVQYAPHLEAWRLKHSNPVRFAGRTLAIMAVIAQRNPNPETNPQLRQLQTLAEGLDPLMHPHSQLRGLARAMETESASEADAGKSVSQASGLYSVAGALRLGLIILAISAIIVLLALGARPF